MRRFFKSRFFRISLCVTLFLLAFALFSAFRKTLSPLSAASFAAVQPGEALFSGVRDRLADLFGAYARYDELRTEYEALALENSRLSAALRETSSLEEENRTLRALLSLRGRDTQIEYLPARILAAASGGFGVRYTLDLGSAEGAYTGMCAVTARGVAGFVGDCAEHSCTLIPLVQWDEGFSARCTRTDAAGIVQGSWEIRESGLVRLSYLDREADVCVGDVVETTGLGGEYPAHLAVGLVTETGLEPHALTRYALVKPFASPDGLRQVYLIAGFSEG